jgi:aspartyl protease family protein
VRGLFLLDTGSTLCVLSRDVARRLALPPTGNTVTVQTANGNVRSPVLRLADVDVGGTRVGDVEAVVHDKLPDGIDGMVGLSFLNRFSYSIDPRRRTLRLQ